MTLLMETVSFHLRTLLNPQIWVVVSGIGTTKNVFPAQRDGLSTKKAFVCQFQINVLLMMTLDFA
jgi:hypothetical protein